MSKKEQSCQNDNMPIFKSSLFLRWNDENMPWVGLTYLCYLRGVPYVHLRRVPNGFDWTCTLVFWSAPKPV